MRIFLLGFICSIGISANAKNYYFSSSSGDDSRTATQASSPSTPWKSISKLNSFFSSLQPGDSVLFKRGEVFYGAITISRSGTSSAPIIISAYGSGSKPVITGFTNLSNWTSIGNGIYESYNAAMGSLVNMVVVNGKEQAMGRFPNASAPNKGYLTYESYSGNTSITDNELTATPNWTGAVAVVRTSRWTIGNSIISSHVGTKLTFGTSLGTPTNNFGYFFQNDIRTLDQVGEWFYNSSTKKMNVFLGANSPSNYDIQVSTVDRLVYSDSKSYITFDGLALQGSNLNTFQIRSGTNFFIKNCELLYSGLNAITASSTTGLRIENSTIKNTNSNAIELSSASSTTIRNNTIRNTGLYEGMCEGIDKSSIAISSRGDNQVIENNVIDSTGHIGIRFTGANLLIKNNYITNFNLIKDDGGAIYTWNTQSSNRRIIGNIIKNGIGAPAGTAKTGGSSTGIYIDDKVTGVEIADNTVTNCAKTGIYIHNSYGITIRNNVLFDNGKQIEFRHDKLAVDYPIRNMNIKNNIFFSRKATQNISAFSSIQDDVHLMGMVDSNYHCRPIDENLVKTTSVVNSSGQNVGGIYDLQGWQQAFKLDLNSKKTPRELSLYTINKLVSPNKFANGKFDKDISGLYTSPSSSWVSSKLDGGTFQASVPATNSFYQVIIAVGSINASKSYVIRFSVQSTKDTLINVYLRQSSSPYSRLSEMKTIKVGTTRKEYEFIYHQPVGETNASIGFDTKGKDFRFWLDNIELYEADVTVHDPEKQVRFEYNATKSSKTISLDAKYIDVKGNSYSGSVTLKPYTSIILIKDGESTTVESTSTTTCTSSGSILREYWDGITGNSISAIPLTTAPKSTSQLTSLEAPTNAGDNYGQRIRGYICAPSTGSYTFYIAGDDNTELWLSTSDDPSKKQKIAFVTGWTYSREWTKYTSQKSASISLQGGTKYYVEVLHKDGTGGDNLAVGWIVPGSSSIVVIPGSVLSPFVVTSTATTCTSTGSILREYWDGITGNSISAIPLTTAPKSTTQLTSLETPTNAGDNYGQRIRGYICAPSTGSYTFYIAGDDNTELWLSTSDDPSKKQKIAFHTGWTYSREWTKYSSQKSASISLQGGTKYYVEVLHKEGSSGDNLAVGWIVPGSSSIVVIPGSVLSPFVVTSTTNTETSKTTSTTASTCTSTGSILREYWDGITGNSISAIPLTTAPKSTTQLTSLETPTNAGDNYGQRIRGYICAPSTGSYTFYIAGDDNTELWLSTSDDPSKKQKIAFHTGWTYSREWTKYSSQKSASISLQGGTKYYVEVLHKDGTGGDNLAVGWIVPGSSSIVVIPGSVLSPFIVTSTTTTCTSTGSILREYWDGITGNSISAIPLSTAPKSTTQLTSLEAPTNAGDNYGQRIRGYICAPSTGSYTFYIAGDDDSELWLSTSEDPSRKQKIATVTGWTFSREWTKYTSQKSASISLQGGTKYYVEVLHKDGTGGDNLAVGWIVPGSSSIVVIPGSVLSPFVVTSSTESTGCTSTGSILREYWDGITGNSISAIPLSTAPKSTTQLTSLEAPTNAADNYGQRIRGYICAPATGSYTFYIAGDDDSELWLSTSDDPSKKQKIASVTGWTYSREWTKYSSQKSASISLQGGTKYYVEVLHKDGTGGDNLAVGWIVPGSSSIVVIPGSVLSPYVVEVQTIRTNSQEVQGILELNDQINNQGVKSMNLAPIPASSKINVITKGLPGGQNIHMSIFSVSGAEIKRYRFDSNNTILPLDISSMANGVYYLRLTCGDFTETRKFIKQQ
jgi:parallel beta-helix repeat protein